MDSPRRELQIRSNRVKNGLELRNLRPHRVGASENPSSPRRELQNGSNRVKNGLILRILRRILRRASFFVESKKSKESKNRKNRESNRRSNRIERL